jgi:membrane-bound lytic murein transglycosylase B
MCLTAPARAGLLDRPAVKEFISNMVARHGFSAKRLQAILGQATISDAVLKAISKPAESLPWYRYRTLFLQPDRIRLGVEFWKNNREALLRAQRKYGVPPEIITAILGVETRYGKSTGRYKVLNSLATLAFDYPARSNFFRNELEQFLLLTREQNLDPTTVTGSYAGAMGIPQFISSSYREYAVDFDSDGRADLWSDPADAIGSVANYFNLHGWRTGGLVTLPVQVSGKAYTSALGPDLTPNLTPGDLAKLGIQTPIKLPENTEAKLLALEEKTGDEYWLGFRNFYVITRYNNSPLYAMAVYQLAQQIRADYDGTSTDE